MAGRSSSEGKVKFDNEAFAFAGTALVRAKAKQKSGRLALPLEMVYYRDKYSTG
jgi:hypothetical protein